MDVARRASCYVQHLTWLHTFVRPGLGASSKSWLRCMSPPTRLAAALRYVAFDFHARIRGTEKFEGLEPLLAAMARDVATARDLLS